MPDDPPLPVRQAPRTSKTFRVSLWVIAGMALAQIAAIAFAVVRHDIGNRDLADRRPAPPSPKLATSTSVPAGFPPLVDMFKTEGMTLAPPPPEIERTTHHTIRDPLVRDMVEVARLMREEGDVQSALEQFRRANQKLPDNPEILYELASCYSTLDLQDEASDAWLAIRNLGPERASVFYKFAELALSGDKEGVAARRSVVTFGNTQLYQHPQETRGQMVTLRVSIKAKPGVEIDPDAVQMRVLFFDLIDGHTVAHGLDEGEYPKRLVTEPIDWQGTPAEEIIDHVYFRHYSLDQASSQTRQFYGFVARLFYDDEWQDLVSQPSTLVEEMRTIEEESRPLAPPDPNGSRVENSLFPQP